MKRFSDFAEEEKPLDGDKHRLDDIINKEITVVAFRVRYSKYKEKGSGKCLTLQFELDGSTGIVFTGSSVLLDAIIKYESEIPFVTTIKKIDRYYVFT